VDTTVIFASEVPAATISDRVRRGQLVRLATGVYTTDVISDRAAVVRREWHIIVGKMLPRAVITDRSAISGGAGWKECSTSPTMAGAVRSRCRA
jgi:hypothetical protein